MCGICGIAGAGDGSAEERAAVVARMVATLGHRGPDGEGVWDAGEVLFGHTRLSIIDLDGGHQPMFNETGEIAVTFNGEIYNFAELRATLAAAGHRFRSGSDTEVVVHGYEEWGDAVVERLRGMFAFAIWDGPRRRLVLARDRYGEKPLYFHRTPGGQLIFASEIKALLAHPAVPRALDRSRFAEYLTFRSVAAPATLFEGIEQLPAATVLVLERSELRARRYWDPDVPVHAAPSAEATVAQGRTLLTEAVRLRLVSDVRLGTITSGGLDSSLVSAIAAGLLPGPLDTFCVGFADAAFDERPYARAVADRIGARFHHIEVSDADVERELDALTWASDEPLTHPNSVPMHLLFRFAKEEIGVTVLLSGEGADEVFGGYDWYRVAHARRRVEALAPLRHLLPGAGRLGVLRRVLDPEYLLGASALVPAAAWSPLLPDGDGLAARRALWPADRSPVDALFIYDQRSYLPPLLQRQDRMSMAAGVEARVVFLDDQLAAWANALPASVKLPEGERKGLLKRIARSWLPSEIIDRKKVGFTLPLAQWLRPGGALAGRLAALREPDAFVRSIVRSDALDRVLGEHARGTADHADLLWTLLALEVWASAFLGAGGPRPRELPGACNSLRRGRPGMAAAATSAAAER